MKKLILFIFVVGIIGLASAVDCKTNNDFLVNDELNICSGQCKFNINGAFYDCNSSVSCYITSAYPNGTLISFLQDMTFNDSGEEIYNYSYGDSSDFSVGIYTSQINCYSDVGWSDPINFEFSLSSKEYEYQSQRAITSGFIQIPQPQEVKEEIETNPRIYFYILGGLILVLILISVNQKRFERKVKKVLGVKNEKRN